jgi:hypothetical protein
MLILDVDIGSGSTGYLTAGVRVHTIIRFGCQPWFDASTAMRSGGTDVLVTSLSPLFGSRNLYQTSVSTLTQW